MEKKYLISILALLLLVGVATPFSDFAWCGQQDIFFRNDSSDVTGYKVLDHLPQIAGTQYMKTSVSSATGSQTIGSWVTPTGSPGVSVIAPGLWRFRSYFNVSSSVGVTTYEFIVFNRSSDGTETNLFYGQAITEEVNSLTSTEYLLSYARRNYTALNPGDRLVIKINASTTSVTARDAWIALAGNTQASMVGVGYFQCEEMESSPSSATTSGDSTEGLVAFFGILGIALVIPILGKWKK